MTELRELTDSESIGTGVKDVVAGRAAHEPKRHGLEDGTVDHPGEHATVGATRAMAVIAQRDLIRQIKHRGMLFSQAMQMIFIVVIFGVGFNSMIQPSDGLPFSAFVFPGIIAIQVSTLR